MNFQRIIRRFDQLGLLMLSDRALPSVVGLVAGPNVKGSWWGHQKGHEIFRYLERLEAHPDALVTRLVTGKVTYLHRRLWPDFLSVATSGEGWQTKGLSPTARKLLERITKEGEIRTDRYPRGSDPSLLGDAVREIERRLLAYVDEIHTEKGSHAKILMTWSMCPKIRDLRIPAKDPAKARKTIESVLDGLNLKYSGNGRLPWRQQFT